MPGPARSAVAPLYLLACLLLGGSAQGLWQNALLQVVGLGIIGWAAVNPAAWLPKPARFPLLLVAAAVAIVALQALPLPSGLLTDGIRGRIAAYRLLEVPEPGHTISLTPYASLDTLFCIIPGLAMFCAVAVLRAYRASWLAASLLLGTIFGVSLGALQVTAPNSSWYLYPETNRGVAVGFFANANHMASLLVTAVPFVAALVAAGRNRNVQGYSALVAILAGVALVILVGIVLNGSLAGYVLAIPVLAASAMLFLPQGARARGVLAAAAALSFIVGVAVLANSAIGGARLRQSATSSVQSRQEILRTTTEAMADFMPLGSGLGSFVKVYPLYESPSGVTDEYVVHAHNDYAELSLELGLAGVVLILLFLAWWAAGVRAVWLRGEGGPFARAAAIASAAVLLHSAVDFPLRTGAISACFAMCLALLADRRVVQHREANDLRPARHLVIG